MQFNRLYLYCKRTSVLRVLWFLVTLYLYRGYIHITHIQRTKHLDESKSGLWAAKLKVTSFHSDKLPFNTIITSLFTQFKKHCCLGSSLHKIQDTTAQWVGVLLEADELTGEKNPNW